MKAKTLKTIGVHRTKARPLTQEEFGFFLAGLMDADGHISTIGQITITFHERDIAVAYIIKTRVGYGQVRKLKGKKGVTYVCSHPSGKAILCAYIVNKLINPNRILQFNTRLVPKTSPIPSSPATVNLNNHWLAGFIQGDGSFQIKLLSRKKMSPSVHSFQEKTIERQGGSCPKRQGPVEQGPVVQRRQEVRIVLQIDLKESNLLKRIVTKVGGFVGYRAAQNTYYYSSTSFKNAATLVHYLDRYQPMGSCLTLYAMWRKCLVLVQTKQHLNQYGIDRIAKIKTQMSKLRFKN